MKNLTEIAQKELTKSQFDFLATKLVKILIDKKATTIQGKKGLPAFSKVLKEFIAEELPMLSKRPKLNDNFARYFCKRPCEGVFSDDSSFSIFQKQVFDIFTTEYYGLRNYELDAKRLETVYQQLFEGYEIHKQFKVPTTQSYFYVDFVAIKIINVGDMDIVNVHCIENQEHHHRYIKDIDNQKKETVLRHITDVYIKDRLKGRKYYLNIEHKFINV
jgi:hypothetical protein